MPIYEYKALDERGKTITKVIDADTARDARGKLRERKIYVTEIAEVRAQDGGKPPKADDSKTGQPFWKKLSLKTSFGRRTSAADLSLITRQFATLLKAGIPLSDALAALIEQVEQRDVQTVLRDIREKVTQGSTLHEAMSAHPRYFNNLFVNMIKAGEASGALDQILVRLADYQQKQNRIRGKVTAALTYPAVMVFFGFFVVVFLLTSVLPKITKMLTARGNTLPLPTQILMGVSEFLSTWWWALVLLGMGAVTLFRMFVATEYGRLWFDTYKLRAPIFGILIRKQAISRFAVTFSTLLKSGIPAMDCLTILKSVAGNQLMTNTIEEVRIRILEGTDIATPLKKSKIFPPVVGYMIAVGEQSGQLEDMLAKISETYDEELELSTQKITALIEPVIIVCLAVVVVGIIMAAILPMVNLTQL